MPLLPADLTMTEPLGYSDISQLKYWEYSSLPSPGNKST